MIDVPSRRPPTLLAYPFRPFFLLVGLYGVLIVAAWAAFLFAELPLPLGVSPVAWHGHEMLFGLVPAAIAGFLLTAMCNWTGAAPLAGRGLLALVLLWVAGRVGMWASGVLPLGLVAALDLAFLPALGAYAARVLLRHGNRRNLVLIAMLGLLTAANALMHLSFMGLWPEGARLGEVLALDLIAVIMVVIGGRITPAFTANWLHFTGRDPGVVQRPDSLDRWAFRATLLMVPADLLLPWPWIGAGVALAAAFLNGWRLALWSGWAARAEPLLWVLHLGVGWVALALLFKGLTPWLGFMPTLWIHAMGVGAIGTLILGVMTRVALGHTGRALRLPRGAVSIYLAIIVAAVARLAVALNLLPYRAGVTVSALFWVLAFGLFLAYYGSILSRPRADGRPG